jgi:glycosyltransferase involved in cell wall biosynthesis
MDKIRVLHVLTAMGRGGAETMVMNYYRATDKTKVQFDFLLHRNEKGAYEDEITEMGGKIYRMPALGPKNYFDYVKKLNLFFEEHPEYKIVHSHMNAYSYWVLKIAKKKKVPVRIAHSHTSIEPILKKIILKNTDFSTTAKDAVQSFLRYYVRRVASHYFTCGKKAGIWLFGKKNLRKTTIINNAVNTQLFTYNNNKAIEVSKQLGIENKKVIGHVGNFVEAKNHAFILKIFSEILNKNKNIVLVLVGDGYLKEKIEIEAENLKIRNNILFLGVRKDIPDLMQAFDLFLFPSLYEGLPMTLIEAQASGLKVVASSSITSEVNITELITYCDLIESKNHWANIIFENLEYQRKDTREQIIDAQYDIKSSASKLQQFYCNN